MKNETVIKILKRYEKSLFAMEKEAVKDGCLEDAEHYKIDKIAMINARTNLERSNTRS